MLLRARSIRPHYPANIVDRPRLYKKLDEWQSVRAIFVQAPAGYGKSSLASRWIDCAGLAGQTAWLSLDWRDRDPRHFVHRLAAALDPIIPGTLGLIRPILEDGSGNAERALDHLLNALEEGQIAPRVEDRHLILVLDDLHRLSSGDAPALLLHLLEDGPHYLHLLMLSREPAEFPLARLFGQEKIGTLFMDDLRFTPAEVHHYLAARGYPSPAEPELRLLTDRSEGWVMAIQLAVLSSGRSGSVDELIRSLKGDRGWLADYLLEEVLAQQTSELRHFLLQTSILDRFNPELCAAVTGRPNAYAFLTEIERADLFLIRSDSGHGWFRYHHLFQELLQHRLHAQMDVDVVHDLHRRAAAWLAGAGYNRDALSHLLAAGDVEAAAMLIETAADQILFQDPHGFRSLLDMLPPSALRQRPRLMLYRCRLGILLIENDRVGRYLQEAEQSIDSVPRSDPELMKFRTEAMVYRAGVYLLEHETEACQIATQQSESFTHLMDEFTLGTLRFLQMHVHDFEGANVKAAECAQKAVTAFRRTGFLAGVVAIEREMARKAMRLGYASRAENHFGTIFREDGYAGAPMAARELAYAHFHAAENSYWQNHLDRAQDYLQAASTLAERLGDAELIAFAEFVKCLYASIQTDRRDEGIDCLVLPGEFTNQGLWRSLIEVKIRQLVIAGNNGDEVWQVAQQLGFTPHHMSPLVLERVLVPYCLAYIARAIDLAAITPLLEDALAYGAAHEYRFSQLQVLALIAWQQLRLNNETASVRALNKALHLAQETGYVRVLLDIPALSTSLARIAASPQADWLTNKMLRSAAAGSVLLTDREHRVLILLAADYTYQQIAAELFISINTVRTHVRHIYRKLSVSRREQAIGTAVRMGLLSM